MNVGSTVQGYQGLYCISRASEGRLGSTTVMGRSDILSKFWVKAYRVYRWHTRCDEGERESGGTGGSAQVLGFFLPLSFLSASCLSLNTTARSCSLRTYPSLANRVVRIWV